MAVLLKFPKYEPTIEGNVYTVLRISTPYLSLTHFPMLWGAVEIDRLATSRGLQHRHADGIWEQSSFSAYKCPCTLYDFSYVLLIQYNLLMEASPEIADAVSMF